MPERQRYKLQHCEQSCGDSQREQQLPQQKARKITGKVLDKANYEPLPGATVKIKGTNIGTATDITGAFQLSVLEDNTELKYPLSVMLPKRSH